LATRRGAGPDRALQDSIDSLASAFDRLATRLGSIEANGGMAASDGDKVVRHIRRYMPFYALGTVFALLVLILPTRGNNDDLPDTASQVTSGETSSVDGGDGTTVDLGTDGTTSGPKTGVAGTGGGKVAAGVPAPSDGGTKQTATAVLDPTAWQATGKTIAGFDCKKGVRQVPWSSYAAPCFPKFSGSNGGATSFGVTAKEITIVIRRFPETANSQAVEAAQVAAGFASTDVAREVNEVLRNYLNKVYELWGRKIKWVIYESQYGDSTAEAQSKGKEGACADATYIKNNLKPFGVYGGSNVFAECAAERGLVTFWGGAYFPERWYDKYHPYVWHTTMDCERISRQVAEYIGKRLANRPAKWAKGVTLKNKKRKFGTYVPNNDEYQYCTDVTEQALQKQGIGPESRSRYNYVLDISRFPDEAARAAIKFASDNVTTVVMACDPISMIFLTQNAKAQNWFPEWFNIGVAANDADNYPRTWDKDEINNALFGMSQLGATVKLLGPTAEAPVTYKKATGTKIPEGTEGGYNQLTFIYSALQAAGPNLTPKTMADGIFRLPPAGAPRFAIGYVSYRDGPDGKAGGTDHTGIDDSREIWWDPQGTSYDGKKGTYVENYGGKRFRNGQWPKGEPPVFTK
jgi:hypothetical protein